MLLGLTDMYIKPDQSVKLISSQDRISSKNLTSKLNIPLQYALKKFTMCPYMCVFQDKKKKTIKGHELLLE